MGELASKYVASYGDADFLQVALSQLYIHMIIEMADTKILLIVSITINDAKLTLYIYAY